MRKTGVAVPISPGVTSGFIDTESVVNFKPQAGNLGLEFVGQPVHWYADGPALESGGGHSE